MLVRARRSSSELGSPPECEAKAKRGQPMLPTVGGYTYSLSKETVSFIEILLGPAGASLAAEVDTPFKRAPDEGLGGIPLAVL